MDAYRAVPDKSGGWVAVGRVPVAAYRVRLRWFKTGEPGQSQLEKDNPAS